MYDPQVYASLNAEFEARARKKKPLSDEEKAALDYRGAGPRAARGKD